MTPNHSDGSAPERQIKSRERVSAHGEVFTAEREVNAMLDLVKDETARIDSRFLEPACGNGNFLAEILRRKLAVVRAQYRHIRPLYELYAFVAFSSIYGIDIQQDNVDECRMRLLDLYIKEYEGIFRTPPTQEHEAAILYLLQCNILWGDALTLRTPDDAAPIIFAEWAAVGTEGKVQRRDFTLDVLMHPRNYDTPSLFSYLGDEAFIPEPIRTYPLTHYMQCSTMGDASHIHNPQTIL